MRSRKLYPRMYTVAFGLAFAALGGFSPLAAQRPERVAPAPPASQEGPETPTPAAPKLTAADVEAWLDGFLPYALERGDVAGAVVAVVKDGQVLLTKGYGYADVEAAEAGGSRPPRCSGRARSPSSSPGPR